MNYNIIATGSSGNATIINDHILIDCGVSFKAILPYIKEINLVLLTHEHGDHFRPSTVKELHRRRPSIRFGCCPWMVEHLINAGVDKRVIDVYSLVADIEGKCYSYGFFAVQPFELPHNVPNCGYVIGENGERVFYATDTGSLDHVECKDCDLYLIEGNHSEAEIAEIIAEKEAAGEFCYVFTVPEPFSLEILHSFPLLP